MANTEFHPTHRCGDCGWEIISCLCNDEMSKGKYGEWDWWVYCSNKSCVKHEGEGVFQNTPSWFKEKDE